MSIKYILRILNGIRKRKEVEFFAHTLSVLNICIQNKWGVKMIKKLTLNISYSALDERFIIDSVCTSYAESQWEKNVYELEQEYAKMLGN